MRFPNPFCLSSSPVSNSAEMCARAFDAGWGGVYYKTLGIETKFKVYHPSPRLNAVHYEGAKAAVGIQNVEQITDRPLVDNLADITSLRKKYPDRVVCVSLMGFSTEDWTLLARKAEDAGAQLLELNFSCPQMAAEGAGYKVGQAYDVIERYTVAAKKGCKLPVIAKMTPNITDMLPCALAAQHGGADGISAINTIRAISHLDLELQAPMPTIKGVSAISGFSGPAARPVALRFIAELCKASELKIPVSGIGGVEQLARREPSSCCSARATSRSRPRSCASATASWTTWSTAFAATCARRAPRASTRSSVVRCHGWSIRPSSTTPPRRSRRSTATSALAAASAGSPVRTEPTRRSSSTPSARPRSTRSVASAA